VSRQVVIRGARAFLAHAPGLVRYGSKPARDLARDPSLAEKLGAHLRSFGAARVYPPNRVFLGGLQPDELAQIPRPWFAADEPGLGSPSSERLPYGFLVSEEALWGLMKADDEFDLLWLTEEATRQARGALAGHPLVGAGDVERLGEGKPESAVRARLEGPGALPLFLRDGRLIGCALRAHEEDPVLAPDVLLENLAAKTTAVMALRTLIADGLADPAAIQYVVNAGEEAVGDRYQRGGGNLGKAVAGRAGCANASGSDVKAFCCGPVHALVVAGALVAAGVFDTVVVVGGASLAKLGMKYQGHLAHGHPIVEDVLAAVAVIVGGDDGRSPVLRLDAVGRHTVGAGSSQQAILEALTVTPLAKLGLVLGDVDKFATELHNPEATEPAGSGNVPLLNYRMLAALAAARGEIAQSDVPAWVARRGMPGFAHTQGHIASAVPFLPHAVEALSEGRMRRVMFLAKGSLFLGRMTQMADGLSLVLEANVH
jgi:glycine/sarcosine/betaine reductase complex component C subunit beta